MSNEVLYRIMDALTQMAVNAQEHHKVAESDWWRGYNFAQVCVANDISRMVWDIMKEEGLLFTDKGEDIMPVRYVRKDELLAKVKELRDDAGSRDDHYEKGAILEYDAYQTVMDLIETM